MGFNRQTLSALLVGQASNSEMLPIAEFLRNNRSIRQIETVSSVARINSAACNPDLVVVFQSWSDEFSKTDVYDLMAQLPLARCVCCYGVWCESDGHNCDTWPLATRTPACTAVKRIRLELDVLRGKRTALPLTASRDEIFEFTACDESEHAEQPSSVAVVSPDSQYRSWLVDLLRAANVETKELNDAGIVLWDVDPWNQTADSKLRNYSAANPNVTVVAIAGFVHPSDQQAMQSAGARQVVSKLASCDELMATIRNAKSGRHDAVGV
jgi:hypothetical protein